MVNVYAQVTVRLNVVQKATDNRLIITDYGRQILASDMETRSRILGQFLMTEYVAARDVLAVYAHAPEPIHIDIVIQKLGTHFSEWTSATQFDERIHWLLSLQCLQRVSGRCYEITVLGRELSDQYPSDWFPTAVSEHQPSDFSLEPLPEIQITSSRPNSNEILNALTNELIRSSTGVVYQEFERALGAAFEYLGFTVIYLGEPGETDLLLTASIGSESYRVVIDAKTRQNGRLESLEVYTLQDHRRRHQANYAVVVAKNFSAGKVGRHAEDGGIVLLSVDVLIQWLNQFSRSPLNLADYRNMFITPGIVETLPTEIVRIADQHLKWSDLIVDLMELMQETVCVKGLKQLG